MKNLAILAILCAAICGSCKAKAENLAALEPLVSPTPIASIIPTTPTPKAVFDIHSKIGIADIRSSDRTSCLRTKNADLKANTPVSIIISLDEPPQKVVTATVEKKQEKSCARYASESGDENPGENFFYSLIVAKDTADEIGFEVGIAVIEPANPILIQNKLASIDLDEDGKAEFFRSCGGFEGTHFTIWTGKPLKGKRIWHSFYYVDYDTEPNCKKKDWKGTDEEI